MRSIKRGWMIRTNWKPGFILIFIIITMTTTQEKINASTWEKYIQVQVWENLFSFFFVFVCALYTFQHGTLLWLRTTTTPKLINFLWLWSVHLISFLFINRNSSQFHKNFLISLLENCCCLLFIFLFVCVGSATTNSKESVIFVSIIHI